MPNDVFVGGSAFAVPGQTLGDLFYASSATTITRLADVAAGSVLVSGGVGVAPAWSATPSVTTLTATTSVVVGGVGASETLTHTGIDEMGCSGNIRARANDVLGSVSIGIIGSGYPGMTFVQGAGDFVRFGSPASNLFRFGNQADTKGFAFNIDTTADTLTLRNFANSAAGNLNAGNVTAATYTVGATAGASGGPFTTITSITVVNGLVTAIAGT